ncbi:hypothetical protein REPUB_Repub12eG0009900 [Reevesia pubescens]
MMKMVIVIKKRGSSHKQKTFDDSDAKPDFPMPGHVVSEHSNNALGFEKINQIDNFSSEFEGEDMTKTNKDIELNEIEETKQNLWIERTLSTSYF